MRLVAAARAALDGPGVVRAHFQPIVDVVRGTVCGYEALARFDGPPHASPDRWFDAAHRGGFGERLEARALAAALAGRAALPPDAFLTVNLGPGALMSTPVAAVLARHEDLRGVIVELTEQQAVTDYSALAAALAPLRERGALLAIDDAGAGFASLQHIAELRPAMVKVDRSLVAGIDRDPVRRAAVEAMGLFTSRLDAWLLAEGVETAAELRTLIDLGVPLAQGYFLGRPSCAMAPVSDAAAAVCRATTCSGDRYGWLGELAEPVAAIPEDAGDAAVSRALLELPHHRALVCVDEHDRPVALIRHHDGRLTRTPILAVTPGEHLGPVARRALARNARQRLDPLALCDDRGRIVGIIPVERVFERLAGREHEAPGRTAHG